jgi:3-dehydroquinate dehydratase/shikimate dehydrogenase
MNYGKICVPVTGKTADEFLENIARAKEFADVIELRIDSLLPGEIRSFFNKFEGLPDIDMLMTFRPEEQGGYRKITREERADFWRSVSNEGCGGDLEEDVIAVSFDRIWDYRICSYHDFRTVPKNLDGIYERLKDTNADFVKIAVQTDDISDGLPLWNIFKKRVRGRFIPIAMGEAGKWTRIMGPAFGVPITYGSLDTGNETAPGQITAKDLIEIYRVKELTEKTKVFGVIGDPVSKSLSPYMYNPAFHSTGIDAVFMHLEVKDLGRFFTEFIPGSGLNFGGLSVTMPHKQAIIPYLDDIDDAAKAIGAVNTVKFENGKLYGFNTDAHGFIESLKMAYDGELKGARVAVLGSGGAARACIYALQREGAGVTVFVRDVGKAAAFGDEFGVDILELPALDTAGFDILVNATPVGMRAGEEDQTLLVADRLKGVKLVFDLITKPAETALVREAKKAGVPAIGGVEMLIAQGIKQFEIWTGQEAPADIMRGKVIERLFT